MLQNHVIVLQSGYAKEDAYDPKAMRANCSCTLIRCRDSSNIIVDTMTAWDGEHLKSLLAGQGLQPDDIDVVQARFHIVGSTASKHDLYTEHTGALDTHGEVLLEKTPGHTLSCASVIVHNSQFDGTTVGICGDLFERFEDIEDAQIWKAAGSEDEKQQAEQRYRMAELCEYIVPGHGTIFQLNDEMRKKLKNI
ncbi:uncharacterized protein LOC6576292 [Drosophila mojavensis]|uniref:Uncharacterized protein, isoform C n=1 Tax=Drosophila mojavensis TaxID=7230 RepID=A0A0Q9X493_DROMO|nr:uncharacterized protein LOC6576292 [Drosophila mojavensis]KRG02870.1 uncharacterized protein Dmoj_GI13553, isoform C [Drosophila mojavensis]